MKKILILFLLVFYCHADDYWTSLSIRAPRIENAPFDYEFAVGGENYNSKFKYLWEREDGEYYKGSDMQFLYNDFKFQYFLKEANEIEYTEAIWSRCPGIIGLQTGGSIHSDMILGSTKYLGYAKYSINNLNTEIYYNGTDYYLFKAEFCSYSYRGFYPKIVYQNINGDNIFYQVKMTYRFKIL